MKSRFKPKLQVEKREGQFLPLTQYDADEIEAHPNGHLYDVKPVACLLYTSPSPRDRTRSRMPSSA